MHDLVIKFLTRISVDDFNITYVLEGAVKKKTSLIFVRQKKILWKYRTDNSKTWLLSGFLVCGKNNIHRIHDWILSLIYLVSSDL